MPSYECTVPVMGYINVVVDSEEALSRAEVHARATALLSDVGLEIGPEAERAGAFLSEELLTPLDAFRGFSRTVGSAYLSFAHEVVDEDPLA